MIRELTGRLLFLHVLCFCLFLGEGKHALYQPFRMYRRQSAFLQMSFNCRHKTNSFRKVWVIRTEVYQGCVKGYFLLHKSNVGKTVLERNFFAVKWSRVVWSVYCDYDAIGVACDVGGARVRDCVMRGISCEDFFISCCLELCFPHISEASDHWWIQAPEFAAINLLVVELPGLCYLHLHRGCWFLEETQIIGIWLKHHPVHPIWKRSRHGFSGIKCTRIYRISLQDPLGLVSLGLTHYVSVSLLFLSWESAAIPTDSLFKVDPYLRLSFHMHLCMHSLYICSFPFCFQ